MTRWIDVDALTDEQIDDARSAWKVTWASASGTMEAAYTAFRERLAHTALAGEQAVERPPEPFGHPDDPAYQRGEITPPDPSERLVEMACCGFRFSADHKDADRDGWSCPMCAPRTDVPPCPHGVPQGIECGTCHVEKARVGGTAPRSPLCTCGHARDAHDSRHAVIPCAECGCPAFESRHSGLRAAVEREIVSLEDYAHECDRLSEAVLLGAAARLRSALDGAGSVGAPEPKLPGESLMSPIDNDNDCDP